MPNKEVGKISMAEWTYHVLRGLITYHERMTGPGAPYVMNSDRTPVCDKQLDCPVVQDAARNDGYLDALKFALAAVEKEM